MSKRKPKQRPIVIINERDDGRSIGVVMSAPRSESWKQVCDLFVEPDEIGHLMDALRALPPGTSVGEWTKVSTFEGLTFDSALSVLDEFESVKTKLLVYRRSEWFYTLGTTTEIRAAHCVREDQKKPIRIIPNGELLSFVRPGGMEHSHDFLAYVMLSFCLLLTTFLVVFAVVAAIVPEPSRPSAASHLVVAVVLVSVAAADFLAQYIVRKARRAAELEAERERMTRRNLDSLVGEHLEHLPV